jgi:hypothetical protein
MNTSRHEIFTQAARKLRQDFAELSVVPHSGLKGGEAEQLVRTFLNRHMPKRFAASAGFVIDAADNISRQSDVIVYDALNCPVYRASEEAGIFPNDNVAAVVEVKSRLDKTRIFEAAENIRAAKELRKSDQPDVPWLVQTQTLGCVFAFESDLTIETLTDHYLATLHKHSLGKHIDMILVLDRYVAALVTSPPRVPKWGMMYFDGLGGQETEGHHIGIGVIESGEESLDAFFRYLLTHLTYFRGIVPHPGFELQNDKLQVRYIASITHEKDPEKRKAILKQYKDEIRKDFGYPEK